jgi:hypothetical protein
MFKKIIQDEAPPNTNSTYSSDFQKIVGRLLKKVASKRRTAEKLKKKLIKRLKVIRSNTNENEDENVVNYDITYPCSILESYKRALELEKEGESEEENN